jgi:predicted DNA binding protein
MTEARLRVTLPESTLIGDLSRSFPAATVSILTALPDDAAACACLQVETRKPDAVLTAVETHDHTTECSLIQQSDRKATIQIETTRPLVVQSIAKQAGLPIELPLQISDGEATVDITGTHNRVSEFSSQLTAHGIDFQIEYIRERLHTEQLLSAKQHELLETAVEMGYYDTPRNCTLTELAAAVGIAKSTCSEIIHRAEETVIKDFIDEGSLPGQADTQPPIS